MNRTDDSHLDVGLADAIAAIGGKVDLLLQRAGEPLQQWLTVASAARYADLSDDTIRRMIESGKLTAHRPVRGRVLIDRNELDAVIRASTLRPRIGRGKGNGRRT